mgnify:CR=1 FL=1
MKMNEIVKEIMKTLGLVEDEEFSLQCPSQYGTKETDGHYYCFHDNGIRTFIKYYSKGEWSYSSVTSKNVLGSLLTGTAKVIKTPFKPEIGDGYYYVGFVIGQNHIETYFTHNKGISTDYEKIFSGNCFRTEKEAEAHKYEIYEKLTGKKWEE